MKFSVAILMTTKFSFVGQVQAYGPEGHALVADMAQMNLMPAARTEVLRCNGGVICLCGQVGAT